MSNPNLDTLQLHVTRIAGQTLQHLPPASSPPLAASTASSLLSRFSRLSPDHLSPLPFTLLLDLSICLSSYDGAVWRDKLDGIWREWQANRKEWEKEVLEGWEALVEPMSKEGAASGNKRTAKSIHILFSFLNLVTLPSTLPSSPSSSAFPSALLPALASIYSSSSSLPLPIYLQTLHIASHLLLPSSSLLLPHPSPSLVLSLLPTEPPSSLDSPFTNLWSDFETLFNASADFMSRPGGEWGEVGLRLIALEGDRDEWEQAALKREASDQAISSNGGAGNALSPAGLSPKEVEEAISSIQALLPDVSAIFITSALAHPFFQPPPSSTSSSNITSQVELILSAALEGPSSIPAPLLPLFLSSQTSVSDPALLSTSSVAQANSSSTSLLAPPPPPAEEDPFLVAARARRLATLAPTSSYTPMQVVDPKLNDKVDASTRERIMRLVAIQREEEEEEEREERERAKGKAAAVASAASSHAAGGDAAAAKERKVRRAAAEEDDEEEDEEDNRAGVRGARRAGGGSGEESGGDDEDDDEGGEARQRAPPTTEERLEAALLATPELFARDGATRRGKGRVALREQTGMSDEQIEGWKIMLDRNPRKLASLVSRNELAPNTNHLVPVSQPSRNSNRGGSRGGGSGGGSGEGGRGGGGRGRASKGSRGHSNAARVRGADRKAGRMGEKA